MTQVSRFLFVLLFPVMAFAQTSEPEALVKKITEEVLAAARELP